MRPFSAVCPGVPTTHNRFTFQTAKRPSTNHASSRRSKSFLSQKVNVGARPQTHQSSRRPSRPATTSRTTRPSTTSSRKRQLYVPPNVAKKGIWAALNPPEPPRPNSNAKPRVQSRATTSMGFRNTSTPQPFFSNQRSSRPLTAAAAVVQSRRVQRGAKNVQHVNPSRGQSRIGIRGGRPQSSLSISRPASSMAYEIPNAGYLNAPIVEQNPEATEEQIGEEPRFHADAKELYRLIERMEEQLESEKMRPVPGTTSTTYDNDAKSDMLRQDIDNMINSSAEMPAVEISKPASVNEETVKQIFLDALRSNNRSSSSRAVPREEEVAEIEGSVDPATNTTNNTGPSIKISNAERKAQFRANANRPSSSSVRRYGHKFSFGNTAIQKRRKKGNSIVLGNGKRMIVPNSTGRAKSAANRRAVAYPPRIERGAFVSSSGNPKPSYSTNRARLEAHANTSPIKTALALSSQKWKMHSPRPVSPTHLRLQEDVKRLETAVKTSKTKILKEIDALLHPANHATNVKN